MKTKYYIAQITEKNSDMEYDTKYLFATSKSPKAHCKKIASNWRAGCRFDKNENGFWCDGTLIFSHSHQEIPKEDFDVLSKYISILN